MIAYVDARSQMYQTGRCGISWIRLKSRIKHWANNLGLQAFKCSVGWIDGVEFGIFEAEGDDEVLGTDVGA